MMNETPVPWYSSDAEVWSFFQPTAVAPDACPCPEPDVEWLVEAMESILYRTILVPSGKKTHLASIGPVFAQLLCSGRNVRRATVLEASGPATCIPCSRKPQATSLGLS